MILTFVSWFVKSLKLIKTCNLIRRDNQEGMVRKVLNITLGYKIITGRPTLIFNIIFLRNYFPVRVKIKT